ncbi:rho guanyl nucleotide exchange factor [Diplodia corticola]|uniref:Rho guanyl nucleotide exchange factor n=1 Tax=Diplodia corticola TaxID=236234 RepID=A0A1J9QRL4_9PEZI|nr:rho guanyl nucleotide exchange factor [Diplodia corticola]OJD31088.1 rho guanyl nucleotide exchange factor [Diplodia corticola]
MQPEDMDSWSSSTPSGLYEQHRHAAYYANGSLPAEGPFDAPDGEEPDYFYRQGPFVPPSSPPQTNAVVNGAMATVSSRPDPPHRVPSAKSPSPALKSARQNLRSVSSPASSLPVSNGSRPTATNSYRPPVKNIVSRFNQTPGTDDNASAAKLRKPAPSTRSAPRHASSPVAGTTGIEPVREAESEHSHIEQSKGSNGLNGAAGSRNVLRRGGNPSQAPEHGRRHAKSSVSSLSSSQGGPGRPLLFGEVPNDALGPESLGYGISETAHPRSGSLDGTAQRPTGLFSHGRSRTTPNVPMLTTPGRGRSASALGHRRSRSDLTGLPCSPPHEAEFDPNGIDAYFSQIQASARGAHSKIPLPSPRRPSVTSESASSIQSSRASSALSDRRYNAKAPSVDKSANKNTSSKDSTPRARPVTPSSTRRYATTPGKRSRESPKVSVQVNVPPPTLSPVLRSSRPRQPVSAASTAASRAKMAERLRNPPPSANRRAADKTSARGPLQKPKPRGDLGLAGPTIADRKALIEKSMRAQGISAHRKAPTSKPKSTSRAVSPSSDSRDKHDVQIGVDDTVTPDGDSVHSQRVSTDSLLQAERSSKAGAAASETEESPVLGALAPAFSPKAQRDITPKPDSQRDSAFHESGDDDFPNHRSSLANANPIDRNILDQVLQMRESVCSSASHTDTAESEKDDSGSINIMLRATPSLEQSQQLWSGQSQGSRDQSARWSTTSYEASVEGIQFVDDGSDRRDSYLYDSHSSIAPDDSVSMAMPRQHHDPRAADWTPQIHRLPSNGRFTRDQIESNSMILKILDFYRSSKTVTPEIAHGFQQQIKAVSPFLEYDEWTSREKTEQFLTSLVKDNASVASISPENTPKQPSQTYVQDDFLDDYERRLAPEGDLGGTAIIYGSSEFYGKPSRPASIKDVGAEDRPAPPPKDWRYSPGQAAQSASPSGGPTTPLNPVSRLTSPFQPSLAQVQSTTEGLGLSIQNHSSNADSPVSKHNAAAPQADAVAGAPTTPPAPSVLRKPSQDYAAPEDTEAGATKSNHAAEDPDGAGQQTASSAASLMSPGTTNEKPAQQDPEDSRRLAQRRYQIKELLETELHYFQDMKVVEDIYKGTSYAIHEVSDDDRKVLFGNTAEIVAFSLNFLDALRPAAEPIFKLNQGGRWHKRNSISTNGDPAESTGPPDDRTDRKTAIGAAFLDHLNEMERVYCAYVQNHTAANNRLQEIQKNKQVQIWLSECHNYAGDITTAWDLDSLIIKPTQRFLKYSLLLEGIIKMTPEDHPDYTNLKFSHEGLKALSTRINETKGRKEIVEKIVTRKREKSDAGIGAAVQKAFGRRAEKVKQQVGLSETVDDPEYDAISQKFGGHFFQLQIVMRDVEKYLEDVDRMVKQNCILAEELEKWLNVGLPEHPEIESKWRQYMVMIKEITSYALESHKEEVRKTVIKPISVLWDLHGKPQKLMQKRKKRLPDYARYKLLKDSGGKVDNKLKEVGDEFVAINGALKDDLPKLYSKTKLLIEACQKNLIDSQRRWYQVLSLQFEKPLFQGEQVDIKLLELPAIENAFEVDYFRCKEELERIESVIRGVKEAAAFSPATTFMGDDLSMKRPSTFASSKRTQSINSDHSIIITSPIPGSQRQSGNYSHVEVGNTPLIMDPPQMSPTMPSPTGPGRVRAGSTMSSRGPSTPHSVSAQVPVAGYFPQRPATSTGRTPDPQSSQTRISLDAPDQGRTSGQSAVSSQSQNTRSSSIFSSAMPMSDSPTDTRDDGLEQDGSEEKVLFLAASLFEFNIAHDRREAGFPYLVYVPGEVFDVLGMRGELWLARNQDDSSGTIGWIWEKHFARIFSE